MDTHTFGVQCDKKIMISIIIPTYNEEKAIGNTLKRLTSSLTGTNLQYEIIITDDHSTDNTVAVARQYETCSVTVLAHEQKHISIAQNRNAGAKVARGDYFIFMDSDCVIENISGAFSRLISLFEAKPQIVAITGALGVLPELETFGDRLVYSVFNLVHLIKNNILHTGEASGKFQMIRREAFAKVGGYREDLVTREDADMFQRLSKIGRTRYDSGTVVRHTGRRAHQIGWPKLLSIWMLETFWVMVFNKSLAKTWKDVR